MEVGNLVRVWTDVGARKPVPLLARIEEIDGVIYTIRYLSEDRDDHVWRYEDDTYDIDDDSIAEKLKTSDLEEIGWRSYKDGYIKTESDDDYIPESEDEEESEEESDEGEEDEEEDFEEEAASDSDAESEESLDEE